MSLDLSVVAVGEEFSTRRTAADHVADALRESINQGALADGALLNQANLATHFNVSRVPVREALRQLQAEGLVELRAHQLAVVTGSDPQKLSEVYELRALLEVDLLRRAQPFLTEEDYSEAEEINELLSHDLPHDKWLELNTAFHDRLYRAAGGVITMELLTPLRHRAERYSRMWSKGRDVHRPKEASNEHGKILDLLKAGEIDEASQALRNHILHTRDSVLATGRLMQEEQESS